MAEARSNHLQGNSNRLLQQQQLQHQHLQQQQQHHLLQGNMNSMNGMNTMNAMNGMNNNGGGGQNNGNNNNNNGNNGNNGNNNNNGNNGNNGNNNNNNNNNNGNNGNNNNNSNGNASQGAEAQYAGFPGTMQGLGALGMSLGAHGLAPSQAALGSAAAMGGAAGLGGLAALGPQHSLLLQQQRLPRGVVMQANQQGIPLPIALLSQGSLHALLRERLGTAPSYDDESETPFDAIEVGKAAIGFSSRLAAEAASARTRFLELYAEPGLDESRLSTANALVMLQLFPHPKADEFRSQYRDLLNVLCTSMRVNIPKPKMQNGGSTGVNVNNVVGDLQSQQQQQQHQLLMQQRRRKRPRSEIEDVDTSVHLTGSIRSLFSKFRVHEATGEFSVRDIIEQLTGEVDSSNLNRRVKWYRRKYPEVARDFRSVQLNNQGSFTYVVGFRGVVRMLMTIPSKKADAFRIKIADYLFENHGDKGEEFLINILEKNNSPQNASGNGNNNVNNGNNNGNNGNNNGNNNAAAAAAEVAAAAAAAMPHYQANNPNNAAATMQQQHAAALQQMQQMQLPTLQNMTPAQLAQLTGMLPPNALTQHKYLQQQYQHLQQHQQPQMKQDPSLPQSKISPR